MANLDLGNLNIGDLIGAQLQMLEADFDSGRREALLRALALVAEHGLTMPPWVANAVLSSVLTYEHGDARSLDEALDICSPQSLRRRKNSLKSAACLLMHLNREGGDSVAKAIEHTRESLRRLLSEKVVRAAYYDEELRIQFGLPAKPPRKYVGR